jgi:endonuclease G
MQFRSLIRSSLALAALILVVAAGAWIARQARDRFASQENPAQQTAGSQKQNSFETANLDEFSATHLALGNPSGATSDSSNENNFLLVGKYCALSYNRNRAAANWVSWRLIREDMGHSGRSDDFRPDDRLPNGWYRVAPFDYADKIYDRGHMLPSGDRTNSTDANSTTFLMTNMQPQTHELNTGPWEKLESYARGLAFRGNSVYQISGCTGDKGLLRRKITIPTSCWKILVVVPRKGDIRNVNTNTRVIAVDMPNTDGIEEDPWEKYRTTVRAIEQQSGFDFLSNLPREVQDVLENRVDNSSNAN